MLCGLGMQQCTNSLHPWCFAVWVCNNAQCTMQQFIRQPFFLIRCRQLLNGSDTNACSLAAYGLSIWDVYECVWKALDVHFILTSDLNNKSLIPKQLKSIEPTLVSNSYGIDFAMLF